MVADGGIPLDKVLPIQIAEAALQAVIQGIEDVYPDSVSKHIFAGIQQNLKMLEKQFTGL